MASEKPVIFCPRCDKPFPNMREMLKHLKKTDPEYYRTYIEEM